MHRGSDDPGDRHARRVQHDLARPRAAPGGRLITLEADPVHADVARANLARAGLAGTVEVITGPALETLPRLAEAGHGPFDLVFIDADKPSNPAYLTWALTLSRPGSVIITDNVVRAGEVIDPDSTDPRVRGYGASPNSSPPNPG